MSPEYMYGPYPELYNTLVPIVQQWQKRLHRLRSEEPEQYRVEKMWFDRFVDFSKAVKFGNLERETARRLYSILENAPPDVVSKQLTEKILEMYGFRRYRLGG